MPESQIAPEAYELDVPMIGNPPAPPLNSNDRYHWRAEAQRKRMIRRGVAWAAKALKLTGVARITVGLHYRPGNRVRRDPSNLMATQKPAVDGLVDAGIVADDTPTYVTEHIPVIHNDPGPRRLWLRIEVHR